MHAFLNELGDWYARSLQTGGYPLIILLMAMESSIIPLPSEVVIPPAAYLAHSQGHMSLWGVVLAGAFGSWIGASAMYWVSRIAGRPLVMRYGRLVMIPAQKIEAAERWSDRFGSFGIFGSRFLPVIRHLIGIPAGIVRMDFLQYSLYTAAGSAVWCGVLAWVGVAAGNDAGLRHGDMRAVTLWVVGTVLVLGSLYYFFVHRNTREAAKDAVPAK